jgi:hypothetical protein
VGDACDNCVDVPNPTYELFDRDDASKYHEGVLFRTTTGDQLDDDADGYGNECDGDLDQADPMITVLDIEWYRSCVNRETWSTTCGPGGNQPCDVCDFDGRHPVVTALDTLVFRSNLLSGPIGAKCDVCPLECEGEACR